MKQFKILEPCDQNPCFKVIQYSHYTLQEFVDIWKLVCLIKKFGLLGEFASPLHI